MCGRYRIKETRGLAAYVRETFGGDEWEEGLKPRYNIAPSQDCPVITLDDEGDVVVPATMRWGFVPYWEKAEKPKVAPINVQAERATENGMFRQAMQRRRCLVPADGFYEWLRLDEKTKVPFDIHLQGGRPFFMAGIFEQATEVRPATFAVLTTAPNELMAKIHTRMPAILDEAEAKRWLRRGEITADEVAELTAPHPASDMEAVSVSALVNNPRNDLPEVLEPVAFTPPPPEPPKPVQGELF